jgi:hypothetical protein
MPKPAPNIGESFVQGIQDWWGDLTQDPNARAAQKAADANAPANYRVNPNIMGQAANFASQYQSPAFNPFDAVAANLMKSSQDSLVQMMQSTLGQDSVTEDQGRRAQERNVIQGAQAMAGGRNPTQMAQVGSRFGQVGADLAEDTGQGRSREQFARMDQLGKTAGNVQQADLATNRADWQSALRAQALQNQKFQFYNDATTQAQGDMLKKNSAYKDLESQLYTDQQKRRMQAVTKPVEVAATVGATAAKL